MDRCGDKSDRIIEIEEDALWKDAFEMIEKIEEKRIRAIGQGGTFSIKMGADFLPGVLRFCVQEGLIYSRACATIVWGDSYNAHFHIK